MRIATRVAAALSVPLLLVHVMEPVFVPYNVRLAIEGVDAARREQAGELLAVLATRYSPHAGIETMVLSGDPSEEITRLVDARHANLIVMGLHSTGEPGFLRRGARDAAADPGAREWRR